MRNSTGKHNQGKHNQGQHNGRPARRRTPVLRATLVSILAWISPAPTSSPWAAEPDFTIRSEDMVVVHADQAWEEAEPETLRFAGSFEMRVRDWVFRADTATLNGTLNDPRRVVLKGSPARIDLPAADPDGVIRGEAREIVYQKNPRTLQLLGGAELQQGDSLLQSSRIDYDINSDRVRAAGVSGVQIRIRP